MAGPRNRPPRYLPRPPGETVTSFRQLDLGRQCPGVHDGGMTSSIRSQKTYDHRLKDLVQETGDIKLAIQKGVPPSTARGWLSSTRASVVTLDVIDATKQQLEHEVLLLRQRNEVLRAVLRVLVVALKVSGFSLANVRVPDSAKKARLLRAVERSRSCLRLRALLHLEFLRHATTPGDDLRTTATSTIILPARRALPTD